jgi:hypothetical protein
MSVDTQSTLEMQIAFNPGRYANETINRIFGFAA